MKEIAGRAWQRWQIIGRVNGDYLARLLVNGFYFTVMVPFALGVRLFSDPLKLKKTTPKWKSRKEVGSSLTDARGQF